MDENRVRFREDNDRCYTKVCVILQFKSGKMGSFKCRIKFFSDEIFTGKVFWKDKKEMLGRIYFAEDRQILT